MSPVPGTSVAPEPVVVTTAPRKAAIVRIEVPAAVLGETIAAAMGEVVRAIALNSLFPTGSPFTHYLSSGGEMVVAEVGFPVSGRLVASGRVTEGELPGGTIASAFHIGSYETIGDTYRRIESWILQRGNVPATGMWEVYLRGPGQETDPARWRTEIFWPFS